MRHIEMQCALGIGTTSQPYPGEDGQVEIPWNTILAAGQVGGVTTLTRHAVHANVQKLPTMLPRMNQQTDQK